MLIVCPTCTTSYDVSPTSLGMQGRSVRCVKCRTVWHAAAEAEPVSAQQPAWNDPADEPVTKPVNSTDDMAEYEVAHDSPPDDHLGDQIALIDPGARALAMDSHDPLAEHEAPPIAPDDAPDDAPQADRQEEPILDIETLAARRAYRRAQKRKRMIRPSLTLLIVVLTAAVGGILGWRGEVVRIWPQTASLFSAIGLPVNLRGLVFSELITTREVQDGVTVLVIEGSVINPTRQAHEVPRIRFALLNAAGGEIYTWTTVPSQPILAAGNSQPFRTRLASPPSEGRAISVRFFNRRDAQGGGLR